MFCGHIGRLPGDPQEKLHFPLRTEEKQSYRLRCICVAVGLQDLSLPRMMN